MSIFQGGNGYQGNDFTLVPSGGGSFKFTGDGAPVPGIYSGSCPGDPGCPGRETEYSGQIGWQDIGKELTLKGANVLIDKYLSRKGSPSERPPDTQAKGNMASGVERLPSPWDAFTFGTGGGNVAGRDTGNGATVSGPAALPVSPAILIGVALVAVVGLALSRKRRG